MLKKKKLFAQQYGLLMNRNLSASKPIIIRSKLSVILNDWIM